MVPGGPVDTGAEPVGYHLGVIHSVGNCQTTTLHCWALTNPWQPPAVSMTLVVLGAIFQAWQPLASESWVL